MRILLLLTFLGLLSCDKDQAVVGNDQILGQWLQTSKNQVEAQYVSTSRFGQFDYGLIFFDNGQYIDRSESGICIGDDCLTENFNGQYKWISADVIELTVDNYHGLSTRQYVVEKPSADSLVLKTR
jgi:hypothetical protein